MNKSHVSGQIDQAMGKMKEAVGNATGNEKLADKGAAQQVKGHVEETWGNVKDSAHEAKETAQTKMAETGAHAHEKHESMRDKVTDAARNVKNDIAEKLDDFNHKQQTKREDIRRAS